MNQKIGFYVNLIKKVLGIKSIQIKQGSGENVIKKDNFFLYDDHGLPRLSVLPEEAIIEILKSGIEGEYCFDPTSVKNLIIHAAGVKKYILIEELIELFPELFKVIAEEVIEGLIMSGKPPLALLGLLIKQGEKPTYFDLWLQIAEKNPLREEFYKKFSTLSTKVQQMLYQAAFNCNNPFLHEPADVVITPDQYSINLMWVNEHKMSPKQEFILGNGYTLKERELDF
jgi:hypothetical protein